MNKRVMSEVFGRCVSGAKMFVAALCVGGVLVTASAALAARVNGAGTSPVSQSDFNRGCLNIRTNLPDTCNKWGLNAQGKSGVLYSTLEVQELKDMLTPPLLRRDGGQSGPFGYSLK